MQYDESNSNLQNFKQTAKSEYRLGFALLRRHPRHQFHQTIDQSTEIHSMMPSFPMLLLFLFLDLSRQNQ